MSNFDEPEHPGTANQMSVPEPLIRQLAQMLPEYNSTYQVYALHQKVDVLIATMAGNGESNPETMEQRSGLMETLRSIETLLAANFNTDAQGTSTMLAEIKAKTDHLPAGTFFADLDSVIKSLEQYHRSQSTVLQNRIDTLINSIYTYAVRLHRWSLKGEDPQLPVEGLAHFQNVQLDFIIPKVGEDFNPLRHRAINEALLQTPNRRFVVASVEKIGYQYMERVTPAEVKIALRNQEN